MGILYFLAFAALLPQIRGLVGQHGILPLDAFPILGWTGAWADAALIATVVSGSALAVLLFLRIAPFWNALLLFLLYNLQIRAGGDFFSFTFDYYLLEIGFLAILVSPYVHRKESREAPPKILIWYIWWLLFRLLLFPTVNSLGNPMDSQTLMASHYSLMCQPLPTPFSWWLWQAPPWLQQTLFVYSTTAAMAGVILLCCGRIARRWAGGVILILCAWGMAQGNGALGAWLTTALTFFCFDDSFLKVSSEPVKVSSRPRRSLGVGLAAFMLWTLSVLSTVDGYEHSLSPSLAAVVRKAYFWGITQSHIGYAAPVYSRPEIVIEGSQDGKNWKTYRFGWKPGDPMQAPRYASLYHPRLDWHLWFQFTSSGSGWISSLLYNSTPQFDGNHEWRPAPWLLNLMEALRRNEPTVTVLLAENPFVQKPPRFLRLRLFEYHFTKWNDAKSQGKWWHRNALGELNPDKNKFIPNPPPSPAKKKIPTPEAVVLPPAPASPSANQAPVTGKRPVDNKPGAH